jgi:hypothetical protein
MCAIAIWGFPLLAHVRKEHSGIFFGYPAKVVQISEVLPYYSGGSAMTLSVWEFQMSMGISKGGMVRKVAIEEEI